MKCSEIVVDNNNTLVLIMKKIFDFIIDGHTHACKVLDFNNFDWECLFIEDLKRCNVTQLHKLNDECFYITRCSV